MGKDKSKLLRQKEDQFRNIFSKRSAIRQRSDKADPLGSTVKMKMKMRMRMRMKIKMKMKIKIKINIKLKMKLRMKMKIKMRIRMKMKMKVNIKMKIKTKMKIKMKIKMKMRIKRCKIGFFHMQNWICSHVKLDLCQREIIFVAM